jgi:hypothetical protein
MPRWFSVCYWSRALRDEFGELAFDAQSRHAWNEMALLGAWLRSTVASDADATASLGSLVRLAASAT